MRRVRGATLVEAVMAVALALSVLGLGFHAFRFFGVRTASSTAESARARELSRFMERLRRVLRFSTVQVVPTEGGFTIARWTVGPTGSRMLDEIVVRVADDEVGTLLIVERDGKTFRYRVSGQRVRLEVDEEGGVVRVRLEGLEVGAAFEPMVFPQAAGGPEVLAATMPDLVALQQSLEGAGSWASLPPLEPQGSAEVRASEARDDTLREAATIPPSSGSSRGGLDLEADVLGAEISPLGVIFLPIVPPTGAAPTPPADLVTRLRGGGLGPDKAEGVGAVVAAWEAAVISGDRRGAAAALNALSAVSERDGVDLGGLSEMIATVSDVGRTLWERLPGSPTDLPQALDPVLGEGAATAVADMGPVEAAEAGGTRSPPSLGTGGADVDQLAEADGSWVGAGGEVPVDPSVAPVDPADPAGPEPEPEVGPALVGCVEACIARGGAPPSCQQACVQAAGAGAEGIPATAPGQSAIPAGSGEPTPGTGGGLGGFNAAACVDECIASGGSQTECATNCGAAGQGADPACMDECRRNGGNTATCSGVCSARPGPMSNEGCESLCAQLGYDPSTCGVYCSAGSLPPFPPPGAGSSPSGEGEGGRRPRDDDDERPRDRPRDDNDDDDERPRDRPRDDDDRPRDRPRDSDDDDD